MTSMVYIKNCTPPPIDKKEVLRYARVGEADRATNALLDECIEEACGRLRYRVCYGELPVVKEGDSYRVSFPSGASLSSALLSGCHKAVVFCATVGVELDRLISKYSVTDRARAFMLDALGAERVESLCDAFCLDLKKEASLEGLDTRVRFSSGYGDVPLQTQRDIFSYLDCARKIGVSLNGSLLMTPSKSVSAVVGIYGADEA